MYRGNVPLATAMRIMRHVDARLTMVDYAVDGQLGGEALPEIPAVATVAAPAATAVAGA